MSVKSEIDAIMRELGLRSRAVRTVTAMADQDAEIFAELERRMQDGTATEFNRLEYNRMKAALLAGQPPRGRAPGPPATKADQSMSELEERLAGWGVPSLYLTAAPRLQDALQGRTQLRDTLSMRAVGPLKAGAHILVLYGDRGCGKSFAAAWWLAKVEVRAPAHMKSKITPRRFIEMDLLPDTPSDERLELAYAMALVIDDAGTERDSWIETVATLIARRHRHALPTLITTNLNRKDLEARYGARVADRLRESGDYRMVGGQGSSLRGK